MLSQSTKSYLIEEITRGKELMNHLSKLLNPDTPKPCDLSSKILESLSTVLDLLDPKETASLDDVATANKCIPPSCSLKRKFQSTDDCPSLRKRKVGDSKMMYMTSAPHCDGYQWRKYGQKPISNSSHPRTYYRCTYKDDQGCLATKKIQQQCNDMYNDPPMFQVIYEHEHTCNSIITDSENGFYHDQSSIIIFEAGGSSSLSTIPSINKIITDADDDQDKHRFPADVDTENLFNELSCRLKVENNTTACESVKEMNNFLMSPNWNPYYEYGLEYNPDMEISWSPFI